MAPTPFRRRRKATRIARNLALAEAALALAKDRAGAGTGAVKRRGRVVAVGGVVLVAGAVAVLKRDKVARVLPSRSGGDTAPTTPPAPQPSNYDAPGPVANTATPIPAPDPVVRSQPEGASAPVAAGDPPSTTPGIDERAEEEAAAAEAAAIGGNPTDYAGASLDERADEATRPVMEAGGGESEGQEQAESELLENATFRDQAPSDAERQIEDTIEQQDEPASGETPEPLAPTGDPLHDESTGAPAFGDPLHDDSTGTEGGGISGRPGARLEDAAATPGVPATGSPATEPQTGDAETASAAGTGGSHETPGAPGTGVGGDTPDAGEAGAAEERDRDTWSGQAP
jgi:hypothetical protein